MDDRVLEPSLESKSVEAEARTDSDPRKHLSAWQWRGFLVAANLCVLINGYDVSNVANIQPRIYEAFHNIELLPWVGLSYALANFASLIFARKIILCFNMWTIYLGFLVVFMVGAAVAGAAPNMASIIVGRCILGLGGAVIQQCNMTYFAIFATTLEAPRLQGLTGACFALGLVLGGPIGSALAANHHATWRWAFYLNLPLVGLAFVISCLCAPKYSIAPKVPIVQRLMKIDPLGIMFSMATPVLFAFALVFSGSVWDWGSGASIASWVVFGILVILWGLQQHFCFLTTPQERALPTHILPRLDLIPVWVATSAAGGCYAVVLYYTPLYFAFVRGVSELAQTVRLLPFICVFIVVIFFTGSLLPIIGRYNLLYILSGMIILAGGAAMAATLNDQTSTPQILGLEALLGIGVALSFQIGAAICSVKIKDRRDRVDASVISTMSQMGGIFVVLAMSGCIYQNVGFRILSATLEGEGFSNSDIREALAGVSSGVWQSRDLRVLQRAVHAVADVISREFWIVTSSGAVCLICGLAMKWEKLDFGRAVKAEKLDQDST